MIKTKQELLNHFTDINAMYNNPFMYQTLSNMIDELLEQQPCEYEPFTIAEVSPEMRKLMEEWQQSCEDCISREEAINELKLAYFNKDLQSAKDDPCIVDAMTDWAIRIIKRLPSITPKAELCEDTISRVAIYEALSEWDEQDVYLPYHFKELVAELPPVTPEAKWIPVSEKLPEPLTAVLLTVRYKSTGHWTYQMGYWEDALEKWEKWLEIGTLDDEFEILAWMELPEKYEEDNHE